MTSPSPTGGRAKPLGWITRESRRRLTEDGGNCKGAVPVHHKPSSAAIIPVFDSPEFYVAQKEPAMTSQTEHPLDAAIHQTLSDIKMACDLPITLAGYAMTPLQSHLDQLLKHKAELLTKPPYLIDLKGEDEDVVDAELPPIHEGLLLLPLTGNEIRYLLYVLASQEKTYPDTPPVPADDHWKVRAKLRELAGA